MLYFQIYGENTREQGINSKLVLLHDARVWQEYGNMKLKSILFFGAYNR